MAPFGSGPDYTKKHDQPILLVSSNDRGLVSDYIYNLMLQCQKIELLPSELTGNRKVLGWEVVVSDAAVKSSGGALVVGETGGDRLGTSPSSYKN